jgi:8-oxo-dGTP pyrophosphatase MutT (NUDIX family)/phosphohistidine phosphatase SixA
VSEVVRAAGGLVVRHGPNGPEVLLVHRPAYGDWTFPKGKLEPGEAEPDAALREVEEETGLRCLLGRELGHTEYVDSQGRPKVARYWTMVAPASEPAAANEVDAVRWASQDEAAEALSYDRDAKLLAALAVPESVQVFLVRHAKAGNRDKWEAPDELRPLTGSGRRQAQAIAAELDRTGLAALVSSPYVRCVETLDPLAEATGLPVQEHDALAEGGSTGPALGLVRAVSSLGPTALSTHGDVQHGAVDALADAGVPLTGPLEVAKGSTWVLDVRHGEIAAGRYVPPPA